MSTLERLWLDGGQRRGFIMELDELSLREHDDVIFVLGRSPTGEIAGFLEIAPCPASASLSLSSMPRAAGAANGLNAFLIVAAVEWARDHDYRALSLNFSPAARLLGHEAPHSWWRRVVRRVLLVCKRLLGLQLDSLLLFNRHFAPRWQPRYVVIEKLRDLPRVVIATMAAERYLPFAGVLRGRDWREVDRRGSSGGPTPPGT
jgi:lysyl-tRNA synthetase class 2